jgi:hypothetical protein
MRSNLHRTRLFRDEILTELQSLSVTTACRSSGSGMADIDGLPFHLTCRRQETLRLSETQDQAELAAREAGKELWAAVHYRRDHDLRLAYTTMPLYVFASVVRTLTVDAMVRDDLSAASLLP